LSRRSRPTHVAHLFLLVLLAILFIFFADNCGVYRQNKVNLYIYIYLTGIDQCAA